MDINRREPLSDDDGDHMMIHQKLTSCDVTSSSVSEAPVDRLADETMLECDDGYSVSGESDSGSSSSSIPMMDSADDVEQQQQCEVNSNAKRRTDMPDCVVGGSKSTKTASKRRHFDAADCSKDAEESENCDKEVEEDDLTSKLLMSIQVLPRIPKRKHSSGDCKETPGVEKASYRSVLERVDTVTNRGMGSFPNWSTSGWKRANSDKPAESRSLWSQKGDKIGKGKWQSRAQTSGEFHGKRTDDKEVTAKEDKESARWSSSMNTKPTTVSDDKSKQPHVEKSGYPISLPGPLPTLPFEEQMRERARLRSLQMGGRLQLTNDDSTPGSCQSGSADLISTDDQLTFSNEEADNSDLNSKCNTLNKTTPNGAERHLGQVHRAENFKHGAHRHSNSRSSGESLTSSEKSKTSRHSSSRHSNDRHRSRSNRNDRVVNKAKVETPNMPTSPPHPYLPVLPLFASSCSSDNSKSRKLDIGPSVTKSVDAKSDMLMNRDAGGGDNNSTLNFRAAASSAKSVTFNCPEGSDKVDGRNGKTKKMPEKKLVKHEDKMVFQQQVAEEMKNYLRSYYMRREITKEEYKDIMRRAVTRICHGHDGKLSTSRIHKYASAYIDKVTQQRLGHTGKPSTKQQTDVPPPPPSRHQ